MLGIKEDTGTSVGGYYRRLEEIAYSCGSLYVLPTKYYMYDLFQEDEMNVLYGMYGNKRSAYRILVRKREGKALLVRHRYRWEHDIKRVLKDIGWKNVD
jgi:hypothetical protein